MSVRGVCLDSLCRWHVQVSVYCAWRIPAHLRCTQCSIFVAPYGYLLSDMYLFMVDIKHPDLFVFGPGLVSTSPAFVSSSASHAAGPHD